MKIGIIGAGISGLTCAHFLDPLHEVTLFEKNDYLGGHANTVCVNFLEKKYLMDTGFLVYNEPAYPGFTKFLSHLQVKTIPSEMSFSVREISRDFEYNGHDLRSLFSQKRNLFNPRFYSMLIDVLRFNKKMKSLIKTDSSLTLDEFLVKEKFGTYFIEYYLRPMIASIWSMNPSEVLGFPALFLGRFFNNHGLLNINDRPQWRTIEGGSREYVNAIMKNFSGKLIQKGVVKMTYDGSHYHVFDEEGGSRSFDIIVIATHSDEAMHIYPTMPIGLADALKKIPYQLNKVILHTDESLMPKRKRSWASWNYLITEKHSNPTLTYYLNRLQSIHSENCSFFISLNQSQYIDPTKILNQFDYAHPVFNQDTLVSQEIIHQLNGTQNLYFCGAYLGNGFHEDGFQSGLEVCKKLGVSI
jgi:predicted NAD/FAD-binding protein